MYESADPDVMKILEAAQILTSMSAMPCLNCEPEAVHLSSEYDRGCHDDDVMMSTQSSASTPQKSTQSSASTS